MTFIDRPGEVGKPRPVQLEPRQSISRSTIAAPIADDRGEIRAAEGPTRAAAHRAACVAHMPQVDRADDVAGVGPSAKGGTLSGSPQGPPIELTVGRANSPFESRRHRRVADKTVGRPEDFVDVSRRDRFAEEIALHFVTMVGGQELDL